MDFKLNIILLFFSILGVSRANDSGELNDTENANKTLNGKTYFIQLKKMNEGEDEDGPVYAKINHYKNDFRKERQKMIKQYERMFGLETIPENLKEADTNEEDSDERQQQQYKEQFDTPKYIDKEWSYAINHLTFDLPNITHEIYEAMLENNIHNTVKNATTVKFYFETDTNLTSNIIKFNVDSLANLTDRVIDAELHVYRLPRDHNATKPNSTENVVRLYQMTESGESGEINPNDTKTIPDVHKLANVIYISSNYAGWQVFKVKNVIDNWRNGEDNLGFLISTTDSYENEYNVDFAHRERNGGKYQPTLVVYLDSQEPGRKHHHRKHKQKKPFRPSKGFKELSRSFNPCTRHVWYVSFHELGWNNFIIAPSGYMAYRCKGKCGSPITHTYTNHGKLLNMFRNKDDFSAPCCVPNNYKSLLVMYYDDDSNVVIKEYEDMIVTGCGCR